MTTTLLFIAILFLMGLALRAAITPTSQQTNASEPTVEEYLQYLYEMEAAFQASRPTKSKTTHSPTKLRRTKPKADESIATRNKASHPAPKSTTSQINFAIPGRAETRQFLRDFLAKSPCNIAKRGTCPFPPSKLASLASPLPVPQSKSSAAPHNPLTNRCFRTSPARLALQLLYFTITSASFLGNLILKVSWRSGSQSKPPRLPPHTGWPNRELISPPPISYCQLPPKKVAFHPYLTPPK